MWTRDLRVAAVTDVLDDPAPDGTAQDNEAFVFDEARIKSLSAVAPAEPYNRFSWMFLLIAFAGLTAVFAGKSSRGRGLIAV